jgi:hypothetical protein
MTTVREPRLKPVAILDLRPTQITVGMREVKAKRKSWREEGTKKGQDFLGKHLIPVILAPKGRHYVIDHHHLARALHDEGVKDVAVTVISSVQLPQASYLTSTPEASPPSEVFQADCLPWLCRQ